MVTNLFRAKSHHRKDIYKSDFHKYRQRTHHQPPHSKKLLPYHDRYNQHEHKNSPNSIFPDNRKSSVRLFLYLPMFDKNHSEYYGLHHLHTYFELSTFEHLQEYSNGGYLEKVSDNVHYHLRKCSKFHLHLPSRYFLHYHTDRQSAKYFYLIVRE